MNYQEWAKQYPEAARDLAGHVLGAHAAGHSEAGLSEGATQQQARLSIATQGAYAWRNNVGATPSKCRVCGERTPPVRYGLANESAAINERFKSPDLILAIPRLITPAHVGTTIAQIGGIECKRAGWTFGHEKREQAQAAFGALLTSVGGHFQFSTGEVTL